MQDEDPTTPPIPVTVEVTSNEIEYGKVRMAEIAETKDLGSPVNKVHRAEVFLAPYTCHDERGESVLCKPEIIEIDDDEEELQLTRVYDIEVSATDQIGNVGSATCSVVVIPKHHPSTTNICGSSKSAKATHRTLLKGETKSGKAKGESKSMKGEESSWSSSKSSKSIKCLDHDNNDLRREYDLSKQRFVVSSLELYWDTSLDITIDKPLEPISGKSGKSSSKATKESSFDEDMST